MKYALLIYESEETWNGLSDAEREDIMKGHFKFSGMLSERGAIHGGEPLEGPTTATTVRVRDGQRLITDGPFAETKEYLAGFYLVEAGNLDEAIEFAAQIPDVAFGSIEVRPVLPIPGM